MKLFLFFIAFFLTINSVFSQYTFINYSSRNGLSSNTINSIIKDKYGFMWFGTEDGLNKFDGQTFKNYRHKDSDSTSLQGGPIVDIIVSTKGKMWVATTSVLSMYDPNSDAFVNYDFNNYGWIISIQTDFSENVWVGTYNGLFLFDPHSRKAKPMYNKTKELSGHIQCIFEDSKKNMWIGTDKGLFSYQTEKFKKYTSKSSTISSNKIRSITEDKHGKLWIGTLNGLNVLDPKSDSILPYHQDKTSTTTLSGHSINTLAFDRKGMLWIGTDSGVDILNPENTKIIRLDNTPANINGVSTTGRAVRKIFIDNNSIYWIATHQGGINKYDTNLAYINHTTYNALDPNGLTASSIVSISESSTGSVFLGTEGSGLNVMNKSENKVKRFKLDKPKLNSASVIVLAPYEKLLWMATYQYGLYIVDPVSGKSKQVDTPQSKEDSFQVPVNCIKEDRKGNVWMGTNGGGLRIYNPEKNMAQSAEDILSLKAKIPLNNFISALEEDHNGNIWIGSNGTGIAIYNPESKNFTHLNRGNSKLPMDKIHSIYTDKKGRVWVGASDGGLCLYKPESKTFEIFNDAYFLSNGVIYKILEDENGKLWVSTNKGISSFDPEKRIFRNFTKHNGVMQSTFNMGAGTKTRDGVLYFGGLDGFNYFTPNALTPKKTVPPLVITSLRVNNRQVNPTENAEISEPITDAKHINLNYKQNFSLDFIAINLTAPHESRYSYMLDGFDKEWNNAEETNTAVYTNLDPGKYTFRLKAHSEDGSWSTPEKRISITVNPPFWRSYYAYLFYALSFSGILWSIRRRSIQKLKTEFAREQEKLEVKHLIEKERQKAEQKTELEKVKIKFLTNLSHELKTPLTLVLNPIENLMFHEQNNEKLEMLNLISRNAKRLLNLVNQLLDFKKIESNEVTLNLSEGDLVSFSQEIFDSFKYITVRKNISFHFSSAYSSYNTRFDKDKLERILINLLSNAIKFTNDGGNITFKIQSDNERGVKLILRDTGIGFSDDMQEKIFERFFKINTSSDILNQGSGIGLSIAHEFVNLHSGTIHVESQEGIGSTFTIQLPLTATSSNEADAEKPTEITGFALQKPPSFDLPTLLVVDDDDDLRTYLVESFKTKYKVIEATDGKQGWQKALAFHPQVIVSDVDMPHVDGIKMLQKIKTDKRTKHIPVILLTVLSDDKNQLEGLETGASDYLTKPFSFNLLSIKIDNLLSLSNEIKSTYKKRITVDTAAPEIVNEDEKFLFSINKYIDERLEDSDLSIEALSKAMYVSRGTLYTKVLSLTGETPVEYIRTQKLNRAMTLLEKSDMKISQIAYAVGFSNPNYFARAFRAKYNVSPSEFVSISRNGKQE